MKNIIRTFIIFGLILLISCDKFLELTPRDQKVVSTIEDYRDILASYMRLLKTPNRDQEPVFGGILLYPKFDVSRNLGVYTGEAILDLTQQRYFNKDINNYTPEGKRILTWQMTDTFIWDRYYSFLGPINLIISGVRKAEGTDEELRNYVLGEALTWRAFAYYKLLQYYSPYQNDKLGIPIYLTPEADIGHAMPERATQSEVFNQILGDCQEALEIMKKTPSNNWNCAWRGDFVHGMMASIYTWKALSAAKENTDWQKAEAHATAAMQGRNLTNSSEVLRKMFDSKGITPTSYFESSEFSFRIMDGTNKYVCNFIDAYYDGGAVANGRANAEYYSKFSDNDIRKEVYFTPDGSRSDKYNLLGERSGGCIILFRLAEMYLIKAEALARMGKPEEAKTVLREFKSRRYNGEFSIPTTAEEVLKEILDERLREFYMENDVRWLDMKRLNLTMKRVIQGETNILEPNDFRYAFPIPKREIDLNRNIEQNPGWERIIIK